MKSHHINGDQVQLELYDERSPAEEAEGEDNYEQDFDLEA